MSMITTHAILHRPTGQWTRLRIDTRTYNEPRNNQHRRQQPALVSGYLSSDHYEGREFIFSLSAELMDYNHLRNSTQIELLEIIIAALKTELIRHLRIFSNVYVQMPENEILVQIQVRAYITNPNMNDAVSTGYRSARDAISIETYSRLWERIIQSNEEFEIRDMTFGILIRQDSVHRGHAPTKKEIPGVCKIPDPSKGYCLAIALVMGLRWTKEDPGKTPSAVKFRKAGLDLAQEIGLNETESTSSTYYEIVIFYFYAF